MNKKRNIKRIEKKKDYNKPCLQPIGRIQKKTKGSEPFGTHADSCFPAGSCGFS